MISNGASISLYRCTEEAGIFISSLVSRDFVSTKSTKVSMAERSDNESTLIELAKSGDGAAFETLISLHYDRIWRLAQRLAFTRAEAEEITQEALLKIARSLKLFKGQSLFYTWVYQITLNTARDYARSAARAKKSQRAVFEDEQLKEQFTPSPDEGGALQQALKLLGEKERSAVILCYFEGLSHSEIAQSMGCAETTVSWYIFMAKRKLKTLLSNFDGGTHG